VHAEAIPLRAEGAITGALSRSLGLAPHSRITRKPLRILAETKEPRNLSAAGFYVNWAVRQFRTYDQSSVGVPPG